MRKSRLLLMGLGLAGLAAGLSGCGMNQDMLTALKSSASMQKALMDNKGQIQKYMSGVDDTARIIYVNMVENAAQIYSILPDGKDPQPLTTDRGYKCRPSWSLDHKTIAFFHYESEHPGSETLGVALMNADGSNQRELVTNKKIDPSRTRISWKPDGSVIYIQEKDFPSVLFGYDVKTGQQVDTVRVPKESFIKEAQTLSPDAQIIAGLGPDPKTGLQHMGAIRRTGGASGELDFMKFFDKNPYHLGTVVWSYDSQFVAYELDVTVIIMNSTYTPGFKFYPIAPMEAEAQFSSPAFSPTGKYLACIMEKGKEGQMGSGDKEIRSDIWVCEVTGAKPKPITDSGTCFDPHW